MASERAYPQLIDASLLAASLGDPRLRVLDATVILQRPPGGGPYTPLSGRAGYDEGHIPGAAFGDVLVELADPQAPYPFALPSPGRFAAAIGALGVGDQTHVVTYAQDGPMWATRLWWLLRYFGFDDVSVLDGGLRAWRAGGHAVDNKPASDPPATFTPHMRPELLATRADVEDVVAGGAACLVNALPAATFRGEGPTSYSRPGRIPGSVSAPSADLLDGETLRFKGPDALAQRLDAAGALGDEPVIAYCGGGISATIDVFALSLLGRDDVRLYDGSLTEWTANPELPVEVG
jgi:thiosulfate/3-mercaptopyruvate sulfurtransferase